MVKLSKTKTKLMLLLDDTNQDRIRGDLTTFFGPRAEVYLQTYEKMRSGSRWRRLSWSWPVFFFQFPWFFYRKMYIGGAIVLLLPVVASLLYPSSNFALYAGFAGIAKTTYVQTALRRILKADDLGLLGAERIDYLRRAGGVSVIAGGITGLIWAAGIALLIYGSLSPRHTP